MLSRIARRLTEHHELLWRMDRQRLEHERVHQVEDGNVGPDAQREREHGHAAHDRRLPHQAKREAEVAPIESSARMAAIIRTISYSSTVMPGSNSLFDG